MKNYFLLGAAIIFTAFLTIMIEEGIRRRSEAKLTETIKRQSVMEYKLNDTIKTLRGQQFSIIKAHTKELDSLARQAVKEGKVTTAIRYIKPEPLTSKELLEQFEKRYMRPMVFN